MRKVFPEDFESFLSGLNLFYAGSFHKAFDEFIKTAEQDSAAKCYALKCRELFQNPPAEWEGVWELYSK